MSDALKNALANGGDDMNGGAGSLDNARALLGIQKEAIDPKLGGNLALLAGRGGEATPEGTPTSTPTSSPATASSANRAPTGNDSGGVSVGTGAQNTNAAPGAISAFSPAAEGSPTYGGGTPPPGSPTTDPSAFFGNLETGGSREPGSAGAAFARAEGPRPMNGIDPEDYFTRVGLDDSIFKIVSRRYRAKAFSWATVQSQATFQEATRSVVQKR